MQAACWSVMPSRGDQEALRELRSSGQDGALGSAEVEPSRFPAAAGALHRLGSLLTETICLSWGERAHMLDPHLDSVDDFMADGLGSSERAHSRVLLSTSQRLEEHVDRGLFNVVLGTVPDLEAILLKHDGDHFSVQSLLPANAPEGAIMGLVIPGYTQELLDERTVAIPHSVDSTALHGRSRQPSAPRSAVVLQWRLNPSFAVDGVTLGKMLSHFESVRGLQQRAAEQEHSKGEAVAESASDAEQERSGQEEMPAMDPTLEPAAEFTVYVRQLTGRTTVINARPEWTVENLKHAVQDAEGIPPHQQRLIYVGRQLDDSRTLRDSGVQHESVVDLVLSIRAD